MKTFLIGGNIEDAQTYIEDITPHQIQDFLNSLSEGEDAVFEINSFGGSCTAGLSICNMIKQCGHKTIAHVIGIAASISSVIACACNELQIDSNAFLMIHNPFTVVQGDSQTLFKEAQNLDKFKQALISIYKSKFNMDPERISEMMDDETWIIGSDSEAFGLKCKVIPVENEIKVAACLDSTKRFNHIPNKLKQIIESKNMKKISNNVNPEEVVEQPVEQPKEETQESTTEQPVEQPKEDEPKEEPVDPQNRIAELEKEVEELKAKLAEYEKEMNDCGEEENVPKEVVDKRVSGMQSKMQTQINNLKKDYEAKLNDLTTQHKTVSDELIKAKAQITSIQDSFDKSQKELETTLSTLKEKQNALDMLNSNVLAQAKELPTMKDGLAKCKTPSERVAFLKSGNYKV